MTLLSPVPGVQVKNHLWLFVNCLIENPTFDSQTKENMTLQPKSFGSTCALSDKFIKQVRRATPVPHDLFHNNGARQTHGPFRSRSNYSNAVAPPQATSCGVVESIMNWVKFKAQNQLNKKCSAVKHTKIKGVPKLDDANDAGNAYTSRFKNFNGHIHIEEMQ